MCQPGCYLSTMVTSVIFETVIEAFFTVIREVDGYNILVFKPPQNLIDDRVVVKCGIIIMRQDVAFLRCQVWAIVVITCPFPLALRIALVVVHVLTHQMEDCQLRLTLLLTTTHLLQLIIVFQKSLIQYMNTGVPSVKLCSTQFWIVQEETT